MTTATVNGVKLYYTATEFQVHGGTTKSWNPKLDEQATNRSHKGFSLRERGRPAFRAEEINGQELLFKVKCLYLPTCPLLAIAFGQSKKFPTSPAPPAGSCHRQRSGWCR